MGRPASLTWRHLARHTRSGPSRGITGHLGEAPPAPSRFATSWRRRRHPYRLAARPGRMRKQGREGRFTSESTVNDLTGAPPYGETPASGAHLAGRIRRRGAAAGSWNTPREHVWICSGLLIRRTGFESPAGHLQVSRKSCIVDRVGPAGSVRKSAPHPGRQRVYRASGYGCLWRIPCGASASPGRVV